MRFVRKSLLAVALLFLTLLCFKVLWIWHYSLSGRDLLDGAAKKDLLARRQWLLRNVARESFSLKQMPAYFPPVMRQEWAIGTLSMTSSALANLAFLYPETRRESKDAIATMIERMLRHDLASFETNWWGEDALSTLNGNNGHIGYLAHLNLMLGAYRAVGGDARYDRLHRAISDALARRVLESRFHYLETFPGQIYIPDNAAVIESLSIAQLTMGVDYTRPIEAWLAQTRGHLLDPATGLIRPWIDSEGKGFGPPRGSYAAWTIHYLNWVDRGLAQQQYRLLKRNFAVAAGGARHYLFGPVVGEAILLAMKTACNWDGSGQADERV